MAVSATVTSVLLFGIIIGTVTVITSTDYYNAEAITINKNIAENTTVLVIVGEPVQNPVLSNNGTWVTTYLPVNFTQTIRLLESTHNMTLYPVYQTLDGIVRGQERASLVDENKNTIPSKGGFGSDTALHSAEATCAQPYFVNVTNTNTNENGGIQFENSTSPVISSIAWGGNDIKVFVEPQSGTLYYNRSGYGIVPADYNDNYDRF